MRINPLIQYQNFGRAFTTEEKKEYTKLLNDAKAALQIQDTTAIVFDFNTPSEEGYNTGIGTTFSDSMKKFILFLKSMTGITSIQLQPQGKITKNNVSPYSGTNYAFGNHIIDLKKLSTCEYANILSPEDIKEVDEEYPRNKMTREYKTDYEYVLGAENEEGIQEKLLKKAYENYKGAFEAEKPEAVSLYNEFMNFQKENSSWLDKNAIYEALIVHYATSDISQWSETDRMLYGAEISDSVRQNRIAELKNQYQEVIDFENFKQFIAAKQQKESRIFLNSENIKLYGDCLIGFSQGEMWANIDCFRKNLYYGGPDPGCTETNCIQTWGLPALDYTKLGECNDDGDLSKLGEVGRFLYDKYTEFFKRYDGIRMDAAWQFVTPFIYQVVNGNYEKVQLSEINFTIFNIMKAAAKNALGDKFDENNPDNIMLELVGISAGKSREMTINSYPHLYTTAYAEYDETPAKFLEKGYHNGKFYVGVGCHDNDSLVNLSKDTEKRKLHLVGMQRDYNIDEKKLKYSAKEYKGQTEEQKVEEDYRTAKLAEIFTSAKQFFTLPDMFGMSERINISGKADKNNWTVRIPSDYERFYYTQLSKGFGLNIPKVLSNALSMKNIENRQLIEKCNKAAEILRSNGPMTEEEANIALDVGALIDKFEYNG